MCTKPAKVQDKTGKWWCNIHSPEAVAGRRRKREQRWEEQAAERRARIRLEAVREKAFMRFQALAEHLGHTNAAELAEQVDLVELAESIAWIEDMLGFHEGSEKPLRAGAEPVIWINANPDNGDFQRALDMLRAALAMFQEKKG